MKKTVKFFLLFLLGIALIGCTKDEPVEKESVEFNEYLDELFLEFLGTDPYQVNSSLYDPSKYEIEDVAVEAYEFSYDADQEYYQALKEIKEDLEAFNDEILSDDQKLSKEILLDYINRKLAFEGFYYYGSNLGSYLGYQAQLPIMLAEYRFDDLDDINDYFGYLKVTQENFAAIVAFEKEKISKNMGLTDYIINKVIEQCEIFVNGEENYLIPVFNEKVDALTFLTETEKEQLKVQNEELVSNDFVGAYNYLAGELKTMLGTANHNGALANFPKGKEYYEALFREATGTDMTVLEAKSYLQSKVSSLINDLMTKPSYDTLYNTDLIGDMTIDDLIPYFQNKMKGLFPELGVDIEYEIKEINESMQENSSPAMYFISPIDANVIETIYVNPLNFQDYDNYTFQTIAHEGFPGHLYQNVYMKTSDIPDVRKIIQYVGYAEGWAVYVENYVVGFVNESAKAAFECYDSLTYLVLGLLDIGINYEGWTTDEAYRFLTQYFDIDEETSTEMYYDLTEIPTNYLQYYFSYFQLQDLKTNFKKKMGSQYSDLLFHQIFLETGPASFAILEEQYENYEK